MRHPISSIYIELIFCPVISSAHLEVIRAHQYHARTPNRVHNESDNILTEKEQTDEVERV